MVSVGLASQSMVSQEVKINRNSGCVHADYCKRALQGGSDPPRASVDNGPRPARKPETF